MTKYSVILNQTEPNETKMYHILSFCNGGILQFRKKLQKEGRLQKIDLTKEDSTIVGYDMFGTTLTMSQAKLRHFPKRCKYKIEGLLDCKVTRNDGILLMHVTLEKT